MISTQASWTGACSASATQTRTCRPRPVPVAPCLAPQHRQLRVLSVKVSAGPDESSSSTSTPSPPTASTSLSPAPQPASSSSSSSTTTTTSNGSTSTDNGGGSNLALAGGAIAAAVLAFFVGRLLNVEPTLANLERAAVPLEVALANGKPTVVEFYANWCNVCNELAPSEARVEAAYHDKVNFVMLNVENSKWAPELAEYGVRGIPHFVWLDRSGAPMGAAVGKIPTEILKGNFEALATDQKLPYNRAQGGGVSALGRGPPQGAMAGPRPVGNPRDHA